MLSSTTNKTHGDDEVDTEELNHYMPIGQVII